MEGVFRQCFSLVCCYIIVKFEKEKAPSEVFAKCLMFLVARR